MLFIHFISLCLLSLCFIEQIYGHGYLADPPARSSAWLFDKDFSKCCQYYNHAEMSCGGAYHQWKVNGNSVTFRFYIHIS
jgi:predicted carbohydrate-binding protein with CBM5 and CBM33 domain